MPKKKGQYLNLQTVLINSLVRISHNAYVLSFPRNFEFKAGQVLAIGLHEEDDPRVYSIASGPEDPNVDILFTVKTNGHLTPTLASMKPGDKIMISQAFGSFLGGPEPAFWIAAGTGLAPYRSMLRSGLSQYKHLIHGGRHLDSFYFEDEFSKSLGTNYIRCCSQESAPGLFPGRVSDYLKNLEALPTDVEYYLCGSAEMVIECREILLSRGILFMNIYSEVYF
ncbi:MAG: FAD-binding oxidoreductase [Bacteroidota bacterium]